MIYTEQDCTITHEILSFTSGGAVVTDRSIVAYLGVGGILTDWHGKEIGRYDITSTWSTPRSYVSSTMSQVYATVDGIHYTGRSAGVGMVFFGRKVKGQK